MKARHWPRNRIWKRSGAGGIGVAHGEGARECHSSYDEKCHG